MASAESIGYGIGDWTRRNKNRLKDAAVNLIPGAGSLNTARKVAPYVEDFAGGVRRGLTGETPPKPAEQPKPTSQEETAATAETAAPAVTAEPAQSIMNAENVATQPVDSPMNQGTTAATTAENKPALGVRKIVDANGRTTYTNDANPPGGTEVSDGNLSVISDPRTEGMTQAQAAEYWRNVSDQIDARRRREDLELQTDRNTISPGDSVGTIQAKRMNQQRINRELELGVGRNQAIADRTNSLVPKVTSPQEREAARLGIRGKQLEVSHLEQVNQLRQQYTAETDPEKKRQIANQINALTGKDQQKFQVVTEKGIGADGTTPTQTAYLVDENGNVRPVSGSSAAAAPAGQLPPGMVRQVGTANGQPVYEDANGNRFILG